MLLENRYLFGSQKSAPGKSVSVRLPKKDCSWKIGICSMNRQTFLEKMVSVRQTNIPYWKIVIWSTSRRDVPWKIVICSKNKNTFLENKYLFGEHIKLSGKIQKMCSWKKRTDIFENCLCGCFWIYVSAFAKYTLYLNTYIHILIYTLHLYVKDFMFLEL